MILYKRFKEKGGRVKLLSIVILWCSTTMVAMESELDPSVKSDPIAIISYRESDKEDGIASGSLDLLSLKRKREIFLAHCSAMRWKNQQLGNKGEKKRSGVDSFIDEKEKVQKPSPLHKVFPESD